MLTLDDTRRVIGEFTFLPGWSFYIEDGPLHLEGPKLHIRAVMPNSVRPKESVDLDIQTFIPPMADEAALEQWLLWRMARIMVHEACEWLKRDGRQIHDPHEMAIA